MSLNLPGANDLTEIREWISNHIHCFLWDVINFNGVSTNLPLNLEHARVIGLHHLYVYTYLSMVLSQCWFRYFPSVKESHGSSSSVMFYIEGILPKGPYLPCVSMAGRALLAGYHRYQKKNVLELWLSWCFTKDNYEYYLYQFMSILWSFHFSHLWNLISMFKHGLTLIPTWISIFHPF